MRATMKTSAVAVLVCVLLASCSSTNQGEPAPQASSSTPAAYPTLGAGDVDTEDVDMLVDPDAPTATPTWGPLAVAEASGVAAAAMAAWAHPDLPYEQWWEGVSGFLTEGARDTIAATEPANIPVTAVGEAGPVERGASDYLAWVPFETSAGTWWVLVAWQNDGSWLVDRITQNHEVTP